MPDTIVANSRIHRQSRWKRCRYRLEWASVLLLIRFISLMPYRATRGMGHAIGWLGYWLLHQPRRVALANLNLAFGDTKTIREKTRIARASFQSFGAAILGLFWSRRLTPEAANRIVDVPDSSLDLFHGSQARGKGVIFIMMHYGDWELLGLTMGFHRIPLTILAKHMRNAALEGILTRLRSRSGHSVVSGRHAMIKILRTLKRGGSVALLIDQHVGQRRGGIWCNFFGLPVLTFSTVGRLALISGAAIVGAVAYPLPDGRTRVVYGPEIPCQRTGNDDTDIQAASQQCLQFCESVIRDQPEHWLWSYKRWKVRPGPEPGRYPAYSRPSA